MTLLSVYIAADYRMCERARQIVAAARGLRPSYPIELIDLDRPGVARPAAVFGTPMYCLGEQIVSLGNPALVDMIALLDTEIERAPTPPH